MAARKLGSILTHFRVLNDPRLERTRRHDLLDIVAITICAVICGADSWVDVEKYGAAKYDWLKGFLKLPNGIPSHDTFGRVFAALAPDEFRACFAAWVAEVADAVGVKHVAIDGKTLRGSRSRGRAALHLVSAWAAGNHLTLGQESVDEKSNEITAIPRLLAVLDLTGALVTIDAMGCQRAIARQVVERGGDYVPAVKDNQPTLYAEVERLEEAALASEYAGASTHFTEERGHGRDELRACWVLTDLAGLGERPKWHGLRSVAVVVRDRAVGERRSTEKHYYISSRGMTAEEFLGVIRAHWGIENSLHWVLDVSFGEDRSRVRIDHGPENLALLRRMAVSMLQAEGSKGSIRGKRLIAGWKNEFLESVLLDFTGK